MKRKIAAILAADVVGYSRLVSEDEEETLRRLAAYREVFDDFVGRAGGRIFNTAGDSVMCEFASAVEAVRAAIDIQESLRTRNLAYPASRRLEFRIGITIGDVVERGADLLGDGVNIAARLESLAEPGGICVSRSVHEAVANKISVGFRDIGPREVKNLPQPVHAFAVAFPRGEAAAEPVRPERRERRAARPERAPARRGVVHGLARGLGIAAAVLAIIFLAVPALKSLRRAMDPPAPAVATLDKTPADVAAQPAGKPIAPGEAGGPATHASPPADTTPRPAAAPRQAAIAPRAPIDAPAPAPSPPQEAPSDAARTVPPTAQFSRTGSHWIASLSLPEPATALAVRIGESGEFKPTGTAQSSDPRTGKPAPLTRIELPSAQERTTLYVRYETAPGRVAGPFAIPFDPRAALAEAQREVLDRFPASWVSFRPDMPQLLDYTHLVTNRCAIAKAEIGFDDDLPSEALPLPDCDQRNPYSVPDGAKPLVTIPDGVEAVSVQLTYADGAQSEVKSFRKP